MRRYGIGGKIKYYRQALNMTQEELATKVGYKSKSTIQKIEKGVNDIPQSKIIPFSQALNITPIDLLGSDESVKEYEKEARYSVDFLMDELSAADHLQAALSKDSVIGDHKFSDDQLLQIIRYARFLMQEE